MYRNTLENVKRTVPHVENCSYNNKIFGMNPIRLRLLFDVLIYNIEIIKFRTILKNKFVCQHSNLLNNFF